MSVLLKGVVQMFLKRGSVEKLGTFSVLLAVDRGFE